MPARCFTPVRGRSMRVTKLDGCGRPVYGECSQVVSDGFVSASFSAEINEGDAIEVRNAAGKLCVSDTPCPSLSGYTLEVEFCRVDPDLLALMSGQSPVVDLAGDSVGFRVNTTVSGCDQGFALEIWSDVPGVACGPVGSSAGTFGYLLLPFMQGGVFGDFTIENDAVTFTISGAATKSNGAWGVGPYDVVTGADGEGALLAPIGDGDHLHLQLTDVAPPTPSCGCLPLLDPSDPAITAVTATVDGVDPLTYDFAPTPAGTDPVLYDFGDGTWDYAPTGSTTHTYATDGTYTVTASRGGATVTTVVTADSTP